MSVSFVTSGFCLFVCHASFFRISLRDLCRRLLARSTSATKFVYFENGYHESSIRGAPLRTVALHAMYGTVHRALINRYTHSHGAPQVRRALINRYTLLGVVVTQGIVLASSSLARCPLFGWSRRRRPNSVRPPPP